MTLVEMVKMLGGGEFDSLTNKDIKKWDEFVSPMVSKKQFGSLYDQAKALLICHNMKMAGLGENSLGELGKIGNGFVASSVSDGGSSISFASGAISTQVDAEYTMTVYGLRFLQLRNLAIIPIHVSGEEDLNAGI